MTSLFGAGDYEIQYVPDAHPDAGERLHPGWLLP
jgi:hypothetical protein